MCIGVCQFADLVGFDNKIRPSVKKKPLNLNLMRRKLTTGETGDMDFSIGKIHNPSQKERRIRTEIEKLQHP